VKNINIVGFDFSINKPAACILKNDELLFFSWPFELRPNLKEIFRNASVRLIERTDQKYAEKNSSEKMRWEVRNAIYLSDLIVSSIHSYVDLSDSYVVFEGLSYASKGNTAIQLGGYKYLLMKALNDAGVPFEKMTTYAPISIKKTAGCSERGKTKAHMIEAFLKESADIELKSSILENPKLFKKKTGTWIDHLDDLVDSYWVIQSFLENGVLLGE